MGLSFGHILLVLFIILILFGAGKLPKVMADLSKGLKAFRDGMKEDHEKEETYDHSSIPPLSLTKPGVAPDSRRSGRHQEKEETPRKPAKKKVVSLKRESTKAKAGLETSSKAKKKSSPSKKKTS